MMKSPLSVTRLISAILAISSCLDSPAHAHDHQHDHRAVATIVTPPTVPLTWGDINFIHTTDTHGWLLGHQEIVPPEPNYSANFGDFWSFVFHMKSKAYRDGVDLLLVDSGDLHDGSGLVDGCPPGGVDGLDALQLFAQLPYDVLTIGNHEIADYDKALDVYNNFAPLWNGRYLTSNVDITVVDKDGGHRNVPIGSRFAKFTTINGRRVTAFGVLFNFTRNAKPGTIVQPVAKMVEESWFLDAIVEKPDLFLLAGHMPVNDNDWNHVYGAIRKVHEFIPIIVLGGHSHIRDCQHLKSDTRSISLQSGRYMDTVGWLSAKLDKNDKGVPIKFSRRYLDPNRVTYEFHTKLSGALFDTLRGSVVNDTLKRLAETCKADSVFGTAPQDYYLDRVPYGDKNSLISLFIDKVLPFALSPNNTLANTPPLIITNTGGLRFDLFNGPFTRSEQFNIFPESDTFQSIRNVPFRFAKQVLPFLNKPSTVDSEELYRRGYVEDYYRDWLKKMYGRRGEEKRRAVNAKLTPGYVTKDKCDDAGPSDDTLHEPLPVETLPHYVQSPAESVADDTPIDLVFLDFIAGRILNALNSIQKEKVYNSTDVQKNYTSIRTTQVFGIYAQSKWNH